MYILNKFIINTVDFLNKFASTAEEVSVTMCVVCAFVHMPVCACGAEYRTCSIVCGTTMAK